MSTPVRGRIVAVLVLTLVALAGGLVGVLVDRTLLLPRHFPGKAPPVRPGFGRDDPGFRERELQFRLQMAHELDLSNTQRQRIDSLLDRQLRELRTIREQARPRLDSIISGTRRQIDSILTPAQREKARELAPRGRPPGRPLGPAFP